MCFKQPFYRLQNVFFIQKQAIMNRTKNMMILVDVLDVLRLNINLFFNLMMKQTAPFTGFACSNEESHRGAAYRPDSTKEEVN